MRPSDGFQIVLYNELVRDVLPKSVASTAWRDSPTSPVVRIRPEQVAHGAFMRHFHHSVNTLNLVQRVKTWRQATMQTKDLVLHDGRERQVIEQISQELPNVCVTVLAHAFVVEAVDLSDLAAFVIASQNSESVSIAHF